MRMRFAHPRGVVPAPRIPHPHAQFRHVRKGLDEDRTVFRRSVAGPEVWRHGTRNRVAGARPPGTRIRTGHRGAQRNHPAPVPGARAVGPEVLRQMAATRNSCSTPGCPNDLDVIHFHSPVTGGVERSTPDDDPRQRRTGKLRSRSRLRVREPHAPDARPPFRVQRHRPGRLSSFERTRKISSCFSGSRVEV